MGSLNFDFLSLAYCCSEVEIDAAGSIAGRRCRTPRGARPQGGIPDDEGAEIVEGGEGEEARLRADDGAVIRLDEVNDPVVVVVEVHKDDGHRLVLSAEGGSANASLHSSALGNVAVLTCKHVAGKAEEDFTRTVPPVLIAERAKQSDVVSREDVDHSTNVTVGELAIHYIGRWIQLALLAEVHTHAGSRSSIHAASVPVPGCNVGEYRKSCGVSSSLSRSTRVELHCKLRMVRHRTENVASRIHKRAI